MMESYTLIKAFHIISVIAWISALLYLPRLFVYHTRIVGTKSEEIFHTMEKRLHHIIMTPAMIASLVFGGWMIVLNPALLSFGWFHLKLTLIVFLLIVHHLFARWRKNFVTQTNQYSERFFRIMNEVPTAIMIGIVILAVVKPIG